MTRVRSATSRTVTGDSGDVGDLGFPREPQLGERLDRAAELVVDASLMTLTLSCDHRILYGAEAAEFLGAIRDLLESPLRVAL
jgi:hypothetical protein